MPRRRFRPGGESAKDRQKELMQMQSQQEMARADRDRYNQQLLDQQRQNSDRTQQAAQERLARVNQETSIIT